ncbi:FAD-dependent oxidoreductase [Pelomonas sp. KK5]|uniref:flavin monoamine oxidase family protein n=1 Tax=Pelomonas sp. KK5 TaxID=1855730 RepID=UPI001E344FF1|nr:FAD-dependent oxidoreductase [Pelomonas sp. KK5]
MRNALPERTAGALRRTGVLIVGGGIAGLACARALGRAGLDDFALLELEDEAGGNSRGHSMGGMACPLGAHYLPLPGLAAPEIYQLLEELGLVRQQFGRAVYDERHLCHSPQERLFIDGQWQDGLLPAPADATAARQYLRLAAAVDEAQRELGFAMPTSRAVWTPAHAALDAQTFAAWLDGHQLTDPRLRWYLDYCCRDDYGAGAAEVSAWAGLHYFASRHGFHPPGADSGEREAVLTWPEGNAWLARRLADPARIHAARTVLRVDEGRHEVTVQAWNERADAPERWIASQVVMATPLFIADRLTGGALPALHEAAAGAQYAPWLVANLQLRGPLLQRLGAPLSWDNVVFGGSALGYVDAGHQGLAPLDGARVLSAYRAVPRKQRAGLLREDWRAWLQRVLAELQPVHPDLPEQLQRADLMRWGHGMSIPVPGRRSSPALAALQQQLPGRLLFAHADLSAYSVFEEAYTQGTRAAAQLLAKARHAASR